MQLQTASWPEVEAYLKTSKGIVIPIGSFEQHGPNGLVGTDAICPEVIAREAGEAAGFLVGPTFNVGVAQHHLGFAGSMTLRPSTMIAAINDWIDSLVRHGFRRIYFINGHGGNIATIAAAFAESYAAWSMDGDACPYKLRQMNWWELPGVMDVCKSIFPVGDGSHATASEVAVTYYAYPHAVKDVAMSPKIAPQGSFTDAADYRRNFPDGRIGSDPSQATPEKGAAIVAAAREALARDAEAFFKS
ncbi:creatininase family protein [Alkalicaulis satelles]|uniref:Creatininase family protein n=1 Tax=Alkalicaulis satelles TaxID=2609175 RepID=A0A5M6ZC35_9PROT|nr:creatininase family protein [Alkalicaulis satelles]KAA5802279.1 creatininase family protein [Alkalicaulis satelles]